MAGDGLPGVKLFQGAGGSRREEEREARAMINAQGLNSGPEELSCLNAEKQ